MSLATENLSSDLNKASATEAKSVNLYQPQKPEIISERRVAKQNPCSRDGLQNLLAHIARLPAQGCVRHVRVVLTAY